MTQKPFTGLRLEFDETSVRFFDEDFSPNDYGEVISIERTWEAPIDAFSRTLKRDLTVDFDVPPLPRGTRFFNKKGPNYWIIMEIPPSLNLIKTVNMVRGVKVAMPWQYFAFSATEQAPNELGAQWKIGNYFLFWSKKRLTSISDPVIVAQIPNMNPNGRVCFGNTFPGSDLPLDRRLEEVVRNFYSFESNFNADLGYNLPDAYDTFRDWAKASHDDPYCWRNWSDFEREHPLSSLISIHMTRLDINPETENDTFYRMINIVKSIGTPRW